MDYEPNLNHVYHLFGGETVENILKQKQIGDKQRKYLYRKTFML